MTQEECSFLSTELEFIHPKIAYNMHFQSLSLNNLLLTIAESAHLSEES